MIAAQPVAKHSIPGRLHRSKAHDLLRGPTRPRRANQKGQFWHSIYTERKILKSLRLLIRNAIPNHGRVNWDGQMYDPART
jgi:hypothetical protein